MMCRAAQLIETLKAKPEVLGIMVHGGLSDEPRHETDWSSDLDLTVVTTPGYIPWHNFKHFELLGDRWLEVDLYRFDISDESEWSSACREGYAYSTSIKFERKPGQIRDWLRSHCEMSPSYRLVRIRDLVSKANKLYDEALLEGQIDRNIKLAKVVKLLTEGVFYVNWEYPPDLKWRVSGSTRLSWKPENFTTLLGKCYQTKNPVVKLVAIRDLRAQVMKRLAKEGIIIVSYPKTSSDKNSSDNVVKLARLFTRVDKYSEHSVRKCVIRGLPWNAHDIVSEGLDNVIDIIYCINNAVIPSTNKFAKISELEWQPKGFAKALYEASSVANYENPDDALSRAKALRQLFLEVRNKIEEQGVFSTPSLYQKDFMNENLFGKTSPYTITYKEGGYPNRSQHEETFAEWFLEKATSYQFDQFELNVLFGICNQYLVGSKEEFRALSTELMSQTYYNVWKKAVKCL